MPEEMTHSEPDAKGKLRTLFENAKGDLHNIAAVAYGIIRGAPEKIRGSCLQFAVEAHDSKSGKGETETSELFSKNDLLQLAKRYEPLIEATLVSLMSDNPSESVLYERLWAIIDSPILPDAAAKVYGLYSVLADSRIPYFKVEAGLRIADNEFASIIKRLKPTCKKIRHILSRSFSQKTERANLLLREIVSHWQEGAQDAIARSAVDQSVLMVFTLDYLEKRSEKKMLLLTLAAIGGGIRDIP